MSEGDGKTPGGRGERVAIDPAVRRRERGVLLVLATVQFTSIVDFVLVMPLGELLTKSLSLSPSQFGWIVSSYTIAAGLSGLLAAPAIDRTDRKVAFLTLFTGFLVGTMLCGLARSYPTLLAARVVTGAFGGILGGMALAIVADVFPRERHGAANGVLMSAFSVASVLGVPIGLKIGTVWGWQAPFVLLATLGLPILAFGVWSLPTLKAHLVDAKPAGNPFRKVWETLVVPDHLRSYAVIVALMVGTFAVIPFLAIYLQANAGVAKDDLFWVYVAGGVLSLVSSPIVGRLADRFGRLRIYAIFAPLSGLTMLGMTILPPVHLAVAMAATGLVMVFNSGRMIAILALIMGSIDPKKRGAFMSVYSSVQHLSCGLGAYLGGILVTRAADGRLIGFERSGFLALVAALFSLGLATRIRPAPDSAPRPITPGFSLGAADASGGNPDDPLPVLEGIG